MKVCKRIAAVLALLIAILACTPLYASAAEPETVRIAMAGSGWDKVGGQGTTAVWSRLGQRLTIPDRRIASIGYRVSRVGSPQGDIILSIRDSHTDEIIASKVWGDASELMLRSPASSTYIEVEFARPVRVRGDVRICVEFYGGDAENYVEAGYFSGDRIPGEWYTNYLNYGQWHDIGEAEEGSYTYTYLVGDLPPLPPVNGGENGGGVPIGGIIAMAAAMLGGFLLIAVKTRRVE